MSDKKEKAPAPEKKTKEPEAPKLVAEKHHHLKLGRLDLTQINQALAKAEKTMGGMSSQYARFLLARKQCLTRMPHSMKKAA